MMEALGFQCMLTGAARGKSSPASRVRLGLKVTPEDIAAERQRTLEAHIQDMINIDNVPAPCEKNAFRQKEYGPSSRSAPGDEADQQPEFIWPWNRRLALQNRALQVKDKISDKEVEEAFKIKYGEKVKCATSRFATCAKPPKRSPAYRAEAALEDVAPP